MRSRLLLLALVVVGLVLGGAWAFRGHGSGGGQPIVAEHGLAIPTAVRTVFVSRTMPAPSRGARHLSAMLESGTMPAAKTMVEVMSDTDCAPDSHMVSRCRNEMRLPNGGTIVLRHPHDMRDVPCLAPGERVLLVPSD